MHITPCWHHRVGGTAREQSVEGLVNGVFAIIYCNGFMTALTGGGLTESVEGARERVTSIYPSNGRVVYLE